MTWWKDMVDGHDGHDMIEKHDETTWWKNLVEGDIMVARDWHDRI